MCNVENLVGLSEIAELFDIRPSAISNWQARHEDWPEPVLTLRMGSIYDLEDIDAFIKRHPRMLQSVFLNRRKGT